MAALGALKTNIIFMTSQAGFVTIFMPFDLTIFCIVRLVNPKSQTSR